MVIKAIMAISITLPNAVNGFNLNKEIIADIKRIRPIMPNETKNTSVKEKGTRASSLLIHEPYQRAKPRVIDSHVSGLFLILIKTTNAANKDKAIPVLIRREVNFFMPLF